MTVHPSLMAKQAAVNGSTPSDQLSSYTSTPYDSAGDVSKDTRQERCSLLSHCQHFVQQAYFTYEMELSTYVLTPVEKLVFNSIVLSITAVTAYTAYAYLRY